MASLLKLAKTASLGALPVSRVAASDAFLLTRLSRGAGGGPIDYRTSHADAPLVEEGTFFCLVVVWLLFFVVFWGWCGLRWMLAHCLFVCVWFTYEGYGVVWSRALSGFRVSCEIPFGDECSRCAGSVLFLLSFSWVFFANSTFPPLLYVLPQMNFGGRMPQRRARVRWTCGRRH